MSTGTVRSIFSRSRPEQGIQSREETRQALTESLRQTRQRLNQAYHDFNNVSDPDLVEACVYEINALRARHCYLLRRVKELE